MFGLYIHWPFCASKCPYCDFNSHVSSWIDHDAWRAAYLQELDFFAALTPGRRLDSIFFGGGTPSLMESGTAAAIIEAASRHWQFEPDIEITLEANPTSVESGKFAAFRQAGINRVSLGIQSLNDRDLAFLGRTHDAAQGIRAIESAARHFDRYSFDLIYSRPEQSLQGWLAELEHALTLAGEHLSLYQLTIEPGTPFYLARQKGALTELEADPAAALYEATRERMEEAGLPGYEVSNYARTGAQSRHNLVYWRYGDYVGIGPGAHGRLTIEGVKKATRTHRAPEIWLKRVAGNGHGAHEMEEISRSGRVAEALMMGLRLTEGVPVSRLESEGGGQLPELLDPARLETLCREGMILLESQHIKPTKAGLQRLDSLLAHLL